MGKSESIVTRRVEMSPQEALLDELSGFKRRIRIGVIFSVIMILLGAYQISELYERSSERAEASANQHNQEALGADGYVAVDNNISVQLSIRRAGEEEWQPRAIVANWHEPVEVRVRTKFTLPAGCGTYNHRSRLGYPTDDLPHLEECGSSATYSDYGSDGVIVTQEKFFRGQPTAKGWWKGYTAFAINYLSDGFTESLASVYVMYSFGFIPRVAIIILLICVLVDLFIITSGIIGYRRTIRKLRDLE